MLQPLLNSRKKIITFMIKSILKTVLYLKFAVNIFQRVIIKYYEFLVVK